MTTFFIDLWHDLREKRLWPVAVGLLAAILAVPVILFKPASDAAPDTAVAPRTNAGATLPVVAVDSGPTNGSKLEAFSAKNPFKPMKDLQKTGGDDGGSAAGAGAGAGEGEGAGGGFGGASGGGADVGSELAGGSGGSAGGSGGSTGSSGDGSGGSTPSAPGIPRVEWFRYAADFTFGPSGRPEKFKGPESFTSLPDQENPAIVFLGVTDDGKRAIFMIADPAFEADGEGSCNPKATCQFVTLRVGDSNDEETFTSVDGSVSYELRLDRIRREKLQTDADGEPVPVSGDSKSKSDTGADSDGDGDDADPVSAAGQASGLAAPEAFGAGPGFARERR